MLEASTRMAFKQWLQTPIGGKHTCKVAACYCTYLTNCLNLNISIFTLNGIIRNDLESFCTEISFARLNPGTLNVKPTTTENAAKVGLAAFERFLQWLQEYPCVTTLNDILQMVGANTRGMEGSKKGKGIVPHKNIVELDAYRLLFDYFADKSFEPIAFYKFGILQSKYADRVKHSLVEEQFELLVSLLETGTFGSIPPNGRTTQKLSIRKYSGSKTKSTWFLKTYKKVFPNVEIRIDGNASPKENFRRITKCQIYTRSEHATILSDTQELLKNFQYSHVFDDKTKNPLLFEACWNGALTPKVIDPLTGHETLGEWPRQFQPVFRNEIRKRFKACIIRFNEIAQKYRNVIAIAAQEVVASEHDITDTQKHAFIDSIMRQWEPIDTNPEPQDFTV